MGKGEIPIDLLEREYHGLQVELAELRRQAKKLNNDIVELERQEQELERRISLFEKG